MKPSYRRSWLILAGLALGVTVTNGFARFSYGLIIPAMRSEMNWSYAEAGWLNTANAFGYVVGAIATMRMIRRRTPTNLFIFGLIATTIALLATGLNSALWWQTLWRVLAGLFGAMSFSTAGVLAASLFQNDPQRNALAIAVLFGMGGGLGIVLTGAILPLMLDFYGPRFWPLAWIIVSLFSITFLPVSLWAALQLRATNQEKSKKVVIPIRRILPELAGYAGFGLGYIVYLTFLSAWMTEQASSSNFISLTWVLLGSSICVSPLVWRGILARHSSGWPLAMILGCISIGSAFPVILPGDSSLIFSALIFGLSVFMAPGAITSFIRQNLPPESWGRAISLFTVIFAISQTIGPFAAGLIGDLTGNIGVSLVVAALLLMLGALIASQQKSLQSDIKKKRDSTPADY